MIVNMKMIFLKRSSQMNKLIKTLIQQKKCTQLIHFQAQIDALTSIS